MREISENDFIFCGFGWFARCEMRNAKYELLLTMFSGGTKKKGEWAALLGLRYFSYPAGSGCRTDVL